MSGALAPGWARGDPGQSVGIVVLSGLAWGFIVTTFESLSQFPLELSMPEYLAFYSRVLLHFSISGIALASLTAWLGGPRRRFPFWLAVVPILASTTALALLIDWLSMRYVPIWHADRLSALWQLTDIGSYMAWVFAVYGGLYMMTFFLLRNEARSRESLRLAELGRLGAEARMDRALGESRAQAIAPELLIRALSELGRRYNDGDSRADRLLDMLVKLLRRASGETSGRQARDLTTRLAQLSTELESICEENLATEEADHEVIGHQ